MQRSSYWFGQERIEYKVHILLTYVPFCRFLYFQLKSSFIPSCPNQFVQYRQNVLQLYPAQHKKLKWRKSINRGKQMIPRSHQGIYSICLRIHGSGHKLFKFVLKCGHQKIQIWQPQNRKKISEHLRVSVPFS